MPKRPLRPATPTSGITSQQAEEALVGLTAAVIQHLAADEGNWRAALDWALVGNDPDPALELSRGIFTSLVFRGRYREARVAVERRLEGRVHHLYSLLNMWTDPAASEASIAAALPLAEETGDAVVLMDSALNHLWMAMRADDIATAETWATRAATLVEANGNDFWRCWNLAVEAVVGIRLGVLPRGRDAAVRSAALSTGLGDVGANGFATAALAEVELLEGSPERALVLAETPIRDCAEAAAYIALPYLLTARGGLS